MLANGSTSGAHHEKALALRERLLHGLADASGELEILHVRENAEPPARRNSAVNVPLERRFQFLDGIDMT